ncbi:MAG: GH25 family lysozyme [Candidatus Flexifilum sp.]|jgi:GH25 family lysozyme M1 (1,4-beta-N-acetylmuramidase)/uncharacterized protein YraI
MTPVTSGIDVSHHQGAVNWAQVAEAGHRFAVIRSSMGAAGIDNRFAINWDGARRAKLLVSAYHLVRPEHSGTDQLDHFLKVLGGRQPDLPLVLDVELDGSTATTPPRTPDEIARCVREMGEGLMARGFRRPIIYTARWFWNHAVTITPEWEAYDLWVAHYGVDTPALPAPWKTWRFWQYSASGTVPGIEGNCDLNWFAGSYDQLVAYAQQSAITRPPVPARARVIVQTLNVRTGPDTSFNAVGVLRNGQTVDIHGLSGRDVWVQIGVDRWAALAFRGQEFMRIVPNDDPGEIGLRAQVLVDTLNVRSGPNANFADVGDLSKGEIVTISALSGSNIWVHFEAGKWAAFRAGDVSFMELL